jgi:peroxiredoxin
MSSRSSRKASSGTKAPAISLPSGGGATWNLDEARAYGPVILVFLRGFF